MCLNRLRYSVPPGPSMVYCLRQTASPSYSVGGRMAGGLLSWTFHANDLDSADVLGLLALHLEAMRSSSPPEACHVLPSDALRKADISFWSLREGGRLLGIGAL